MGKIVELLHLKIYPFTFNPTALRTILSAIGLMIFIRNMFTVADLLLFRP